MEQADDRERAADADELLVIRCQLGERAAFDALTARWAGPIARYARRVTGDADRGAELTQDIWLRVIRGIGRLRDGRRLRPWLFGIAHRAFIDTLRHRYAAPPLVEFAEEEIAGIATEDDSALRDDLEALDHHLAALPPAEREALSLFYFDALSIAQLAEVLAIPPGTVKSRLFRARQMLRHHFEQGDCHDHRP
ncbi:RNA polymerase sigma-70 factor (ECF subfamily) [Sphingomonas zeicaulis]|uniref:RNA polymerase sigma factor n=1 Tax=Sphingomonas zeicaulis TaxID=1632740 RepID=UPI003D1B36B7